MDEPRSPPILLIRPTPNSRTMTPTMIAISRGPSGPTIKETRHNALPDLRHSPEKVSHVMVHDAAMRESAAHSLSGYV